MAAALSAVISYCDRLVVGYGEEDGEVIDDDREDGGEVDEDGEDGGGRAL